MRFKIICVGKIKETYYVNIIETYRKQIEKFHELKIIQYDDEKIPQNASESIKQRIVEKESSLCMTGIEKGDYVIALCVDGKKCTTKEFSRKIDDIRERGYQTVTFLIGGSLGMSEALIRKADFKLSFSDMTFPHQLMRVMLMDQIQLICGK
jgi:ribosomal RNA large subunit methyltransferase H